MRLSPNILDSKFNKQVAKVLARVPRFLQHGLLRGDSYYLRNSFAYRVREEDATASSDITKAPFVS